MIRGRTITAADVHAVQQLVAVQPGVSRWALARALCERWQWQAANGAWKTRSALAVLTELARRELIALPPTSASYGYLQRAVGGAVKEDAAAASPMEGACRQYRPLHWELVGTAAQRRQWRELLAAHHYLGAPASVGASLKYLVYGRGGELLGAVGWQSAVHHLGCRDRLLGWTAAQRAQGLERVVNNVRLLVLPWVQVRNLVSVILSESIEVLQRDWRARYGVALWLAESFVDRGRFSGASYRSANWQAIGWTRGFTQCQGRWVLQGPAKEVYVYVIEPRARRLVHADSAQPLLSRGYLLAQRLSETRQPLTRRTRMKNVPELWKPKLPPTWELSVADVECLGRELSAFTGLFRDLLGRIEVFELGTRYLQGLLSATARKNVEAMALGLEGPALVRSLQRFVSEYQWDEGAVRQRHWELCAQSLSDPQGVWSIDASEFAKKGKASVGVAPQYCGALGKTANCQSGVFVCYSSPKGHVLLDRRLYLPQCWFEPAWAERREQCRIPQDVRFQTKPQLALGLLQSLMASGLFGGQWIACDCSFGNNEEFLAELPADCYYLAEVPCTRKVWVQKAPQRRSLETEGGTVESLLGVKGLLNWQTHKVSEGEKGPIVAAFARVRVYVTAERTPASARWLLLRNDANHKLKYALSNAPADLPMSELVRVSGARWPIERCFEEDKSELGLDHYEHRSWPAWHRHMSLVFLAQLFLLRLRLTYKKSPGVDAATGAALDRMESAGPEAGRGLPPRSGAVLSTAQSPSLRIPS